MYLTFHDGTDMYIHTPNTYIVNVTGVVTAGIGSAGVTSSLVAEASAKCSAIGCPVPSCVVKVSHTVLFSASCAGTELWNHKEEPPDSIEAANRRHMWVPVAVFVARVAWSWGGSYVVSSIVQSTMRG